MSSLSHFAYQIEMLANQPRSKKLTHKIITLSYALKYQIELKLYEQILHFRDFFYLLIRLTYDCCKVD